MNDTLLKVLNHITAQYGAEVLGDPRRLKAFFADLAKDEPRPLRIAFGRCVESGAYTALKNAPDAAERALCKAAIAQKVRDEHGIDPALCAEALDILEAALYREEQPPLFCTSCGEAVQENWKMCPHCGTALAREAPPVQSRTQNPVKKKHTLRNALIAAGVVAAAVIAGVAASAAATPAANMIRIPGGTFTMGSPANVAGRYDDEIRHQVTVSAFSIGKYEVTQAEWRGVMGNNPSRFRGDNLPVERVIWYEAVEYCNRRSQREGLRPAYTINGTNVSWNRSANGYRLPTEAEWEYACRAGTTTPFNTGNNITTSQANYDGNGPYNNNAKGTYREKTVDAGSFAPNAWSLYDMHGNVWEWCWDWYGNYESGAQSDPAGPSTGSDRVIRGGSWLDDARYLRSSNRDGDTPSIRSSYLGFRLVRSP